MKKVRYFIEAVLLTILMIVFKILPLDWASSLGGTIGKTIGPRLAASRKARRNIQMALPEVDTEREDEIISGMWENLGRVVAEYPHLTKLGKGRIKIDYPPELAAVLEEKKPCMMIAAHLANWEIAAPVMRDFFDIEIDITYRAPNNPWVDKLLLKLRSIGGKVRAYPKSRSGGQQLIKAMRERRYIAMLIDQKYNEGVAVPFFGYDAMTNPVFAQLATKFDYLLVPSHIRRTRGAHFEVKLHNPLETKNKTTEEIIAEAHTIMEEWIRQSPEQWLWLHRRWDSQQLKENKE